MGQHVPESTIASTLHCWRNVLSSAHGLLRDVAGNGNATSSAETLLRIRLAFTAVAHLALSSDQIVHCDFDTPLMFVEDPVVGGISYGDNGEIGVPEVIGLGASFDVRYLKRLGKVVV